MVGGGGGGWELEVHHAEQDAAAHAGNDLKFLAFLEKAEGIEFVRMTAQRT